MSVEWWRLTAVGVGRSSVGAECASELGERFLIRVIRGPGCRFASLFLTHPIWCERGHWVVLWVWRRACVVCQAKVR